MERNSKNVLGVQLQDTHANSFPAEEPQQCINIGYNSMWRTGVNVNVYVLVCDVCVSPVLR